MRTRNCIISPSFDLTFWKLRATLYTEPQQPGSHIDFLTLFLIFIFCICYSLSLIVCYIWCHNGLNKLPSGISGKLWSAKHAIHIRQLVIRFSNPFDKELEDKFLSKVDLQSLKGKTIFYFSLHYSLQTTGAQSMPPKATRANTCWLSVWLIFLGTWYNLGGYFWSLNRRCRIRSRWRRPWFLQWALFCSYRGRQTCWSLDAWWQGVLRLQHHVPGGSRRR